MKWRFWRKNPRPEDLSGLSLINLERRLLALEQAMDLQRTMLDERTRVMADAIATEFRAVGRIMADLAHAMAQLDSRLATKIENELIAPRAVPDAVDPSMVLPPSPEMKDSLTPPLPANDPPASVPRDIDPLLLDALAKGRFAFDITAVSSIPPRTTLLSLMRFAPPLPTIDSPTADRLAELFPDAALLLDRFMMDAATSMVQRGQAPSALPLLVPVTPISAGDVDFPADFRRRFERLNHPGGVFPLLSEAGWIALVEAQHAAQRNGLMPETLYALRASGERRADPAALAGWGVRYLLAPASLLATPEVHPMAPDIHAADVARLFARAGISVIAEDVPDHVTVLGLLRNNVTMGWGSAFQPEAASPAADAKSDPPAERQDYRAYLRRAGS